MPESQLRRRAPVALAAAGLAWRVGPLLWTGTVLLAVSSGTFAPVGAWLLKSVVDELARPDPPIATVATLAAATVLLQGLSLGIGGLAALAAAACQRRISVTVASDLYRAVNAISGQSRFDDPTFQDSLRLAEDAAEQVPSGLTAMLGTVLQGVMVIGSFAGLLVAIWPPMLGLVVLACAPGVVVQAVLTRQMARVSEANASRWRRWILLRGLLTEPRSIPELRLLGLGDFFRDRLVGALSAVRTADYELKRLFAGTQGGLALIGAGVTAVGTVVVAARAARHQLSAGDLVLFLAAVAGIQAAVTGTLREATSLGAALRLLRHYVAIVSDSEGDTPAMAALAPPPLRRGIEMRDVWFRYQDGDWVLRGVSATIGFGKAVAIVGENGAGKSTLIRLLCRLYDPQQGAITWDGVDVREMDPVALRQRMAITFQDFQVYDLTAAENIGIGDLPAIADRERIARVAGHAGIGEALAGLPSGYDTVLGTLFLSDAGDRGTSLSGGHEQRLALARTLMRQDVDLVILDEPSAGLDARGEHQLHLRLRRFRRGRTSLLVSHRLSTVRDADLILVLDGGRIAEQGTHDELMAAAGLYARFFTLQASAYQDGRVGAEPAVTG